MLSKEYREAISETLEILEYTRREDVEKIPTMFMEYLKQNGLKTYKPKLDHTKKIADMDLNEKTRAILTIIYRKYWCEGEQKEEIDKVLQENEEKYRKEIGEKYNTINLFRVKK